MNKYRVDLAGRWEKEVSLLNGTDLKEVMVDIRTRMKDDLAAEEVRINPTDAMHSIDGGWRDPRYPLVTGTFAVTGLHFYAGSMDEAMQAARSMVRNWLDKNTCSAPKLMFTNEHYERESA